MRPFHEDGVGQTDGDVDVDGSECGCGGTGTWLVVSDGGWLFVGWERGRQVGWLAGGSRAASQMTGVCLQEGG